MFIKLSAVSIAAFIILAFPVFSADGPTVGAAEVAVSPVIPYYHHDSAHNIHLFASNHVIENPDFLPALTKILASPAARKVTLVIEDASMLFRAPGVGREQGTESYLIAAALGYGKIDAKIGNYFLSAIRHSQGAEGELDPRIYQAKFQKPFSEFCQTVEAHRPGLTIRILDPISEAAVQAPPETHNPGQGLLPRGLVERQILTAFYRIRKHDANTPYAESGLARELEALSLAHRPTPDNIRRERDHKWAQTLEKAMRSREDVDSHTIIVITGAAHLAYLSHEPSPFVEFLLQQQIIVPQERMRLFGKEGTPAPWIAKSIAAKESGNELFGVKKFNQALTAYTNAVLYGLMAERISAATAAPAELTGQAQDALVFALNNAAAAALKVPRFADQAKAFAELSLLIKYTEKGFFRFCAGAVAALGNGIMAGTCIFSTGIGFALPKAKIYQSMKEAGLNEQTIAIFQGDGSAAEGDFMMAMMQMLKGGKLS